MTADDLDKKIKAEAAKVRQPALPTGRKVIASVLPTITDLRTQGYKWAEIALALERAGVIRPDGKPFTALILRQYYGSLTSGADDKGEEQ